MTETALRLEIRGLVQGVGYRAALLEQARRLGLRGWVRNRHDGSVEALACGAPDALQRLLDWSRHGPPGARVDGVASFTAAGGFATFEVWPTA